MVRVTRFADVPGTRTRSPGIPPQPAVAATVTHFTAAFAAVGGGGPIIRLVEKPAPHDMNADSPHARLES